jgi:hypothetical protein
MIGSPPACRLAPVPDRRFRWIATAIGHLLQLLHFASLCDEERGGLGRFRISSEITASCSLIRDLRLNHKSAIDSTRSLPESRPHQYSFALAACQWKHRMARNRSMLFMSLLMLSGGGFFVPVAPVLAQHVSREQDIGDLRLGQRVKVDDGTCPAGQIKEVSGTRMTSTGIVRTQKCIPRLGPKHR